MTASLRSLIIRAPFGQADCESEVKILKSEYSELYFDETPFNTAAIDPQTYLIIGRRGSGKTALAQYFSFQGTFRNPIYIDVDEPAIYQQVLSDIAARASEAREIAIPRLKKVWEYVLWCVIFEHLRGHSSTIAQACDEKCPAGRPSSLINFIFDRLLVFFHESSGKLIDERIDQILSDETLNLARSEALKLAKINPIIIALDTLEKYDAANNALMNAMAALVQCAAEFNLNFSDEGIHLKVFMSGEVFPLLEEEVIQNPLKSIKEPVYLFWRPKDLLRLISWRFYRYLETHGLLRPESRGAIQWTSHNEVLHKMWRPYFGQYITNARNLREHTFSYVLRHTQMRPRQLILLCNSIADQAVKGGRFPIFSEHDIRAGVKNLEGNLAVEIINSFSSLYPQVSTIVDALMKIPMLFSGNELDKRASQSASEWPPNTYTPAKFRRLVAELGIVGRVMRHNQEAGYIDADFEYSLRTRLPITHRDECVIHPMFYRRFNVEFNCPSRVIPFSTERKAQEDNDNFW
jgi:hypothetical protein